MCTCAILSILRLEINIAKTTTHMENKRQSIKIVPRGGTSAEGTGGSIRISRHSALLAVVDHSRCRKMFAVQSHERPLGRRRLGRSSRSSELDRPLGRRRSRSAGVEEDDLVGEQSRKTLPKNLIVRTPEQVSRCRVSGSGGLHFRSLCAQRFGPGMDIKQRD